MKKMLCCLALAALTLSVSACSENNSSEPAKETKPAATAPVAPKSTTAPTAAPATAPAQQAEPVMPPPAAPQSAPATAPAAPHN